MSSHIKRQLLSLLHSAAADEEEKSKLRRIPEVERTLPRSDHRALVTEEMFPLGRGAVTLNPGPEQDSENQREQVRLYGGV